MFTPPPSPDPPRVYRGRHEPEEPYSLDAHDGSVLTVTRSSIPATPSSCTTGYLPTPPPSCLSTPEKLCTPIDETYLRLLTKKRRNARRLKFSILVVPIVLVIITLSTRCMSHPAVLDILSADEAAQGWRTLAGSVLDWQGHIHDPHEKREAEYELQFEARSPQSASGIAFPDQPTGSATSVLTASEAASSTAPPVAATSSSGSSTIPTIPSEPPVLPTPFPQPFDSTGITTNFSTEECHNFFVNMTQTAPFRQCRPFSMLIQHSSAFIGAQFNLSELNDIMWGTCNTDLSAEVCEANMEWFAEELQDVCATDLKANNQVATSSLLGLQTYSLLRQAACLSSNTTDAYCYVTALSSEAHPADAYYYTLPLGSPLPNSSDPSCSSCTQQIMSEFVTQGLNTSGLRETYAGAAIITNKVCGSGFVQEMEVQNNSAGERGRARWWAVVGVCALVSVGVGGAWW
ncbi:hypothetical protein FOMPIDRAFT_1025863 [Fomitopsis schrenkii]|uniref:DUF7729 domain-containing protein n=1 Tax=Fomitopsis schrenkii TaxID=2126942 RepID=S8F9C0_FOMSC|nr:hypothetical protein FOMPIDRAFT_1025863 [Fomitopsis schrenkii]